MNAVYQIKKPELISDETLDSNDSRLKALGATVVTKNPNYKSINSSSINLEGGVVGEPSVPYLKQECNNKGNNNFRDSQFTTK
jgi:hypothetical protein